ncbi:MAG: hypothetical protein JNM79_20710 [Burkholderiales bacterium]|nr:hypothetical protein [Burkholderiales bacterium]
MRRRAFVGAGAAGLLAGPARAQADYPVRPVRLIVPNSPGSSVDTVGRALALHLGTTLNQSVFVENRAGASGLLGLDVGRAAPADGHTLMVASTSSMSVAPLLKKALPFDVMRDFDFVAQIAVLPNVVAANAGLGINNVRGLIAYAKAHPGRVNMASAGVGSISHLAGVALSTAAGFDSLHVPYTGGGPSVASVAAGQSHWTIAPAPAIMPMAKTGRIKPLGHSMARGASVLEGLPSIADEVPGFEFNAWIGIVAPKGLPPPVLTKVRSALDAALRLPALETSFAGNGAFVRFTTPTEFRAMLTADIELNRRAMKTAAIEPE